MLSAAHVPTFAQAQAAQAHKVNYHMLGIESSAHHLQAVVFDEFNHPVSNKAAPQEDHEDSDSGLERFRHTCFHLFSLLHALCIQHLRTDWDLNNLRPHLPSELAPPVVSVPTTWHYSIQLAA